MSASDHRPMRLTSIGVKTDRSRFAAIRRFYVNAWGLVLRHEAEHEIVFGLVGRHGSAFAFRDSANAPNIELDFEVESAEDTLHPCPGLIINLRQSTSGGEKFASSPVGTPYALSHIVINTPDQDSLVQWFVQTLGFRISDVTRSMTFLRCNTNHHTVAISLGKRLSINHIAFEMYSLDDLMSATSRLRRKGHEAEWGLGRHGPGNNIFNYYVDPSGMAVELTTDLEQVLDENYIPRGSEFWSNYPNRPCRWGMATNPSDALKKAFSGAR